MKNLFLSICIFLGMQASSQITVDGAAGAITVPNNGPAVVVDNSLTVQTALTIPAFRASISANYNAGDVLSFDAAAKPAAVTASYSAGVLSFSGNATAAEYQALLRTVKFATTSTNALSRTISFEAGDGSLKYYNGHFYRMVAGSYSWTTAKAAAETESFFGWQGYLANITSAGENSFIWNSVGKGWIGASDAATEGAWKWMSGPEAGTQFSSGATVLGGQYASWQSGEPNNSNGTEHYAENNYPNNGNWNDAANTNNSSYVVEFGQWPSAVAVDIFHTRSVTMIATQVSTTATAAPYSLHAPAFVVDPNLVIYTATNFTQGKATISGNFKTGDVLGFTGTLPGTFSGTYNSTTGVLSFSTTGTITAQQWQDLFRSVTFYSSSNTVGNRDVTFSLGNATASNNGHFYEYMSSAVNWPTARTNADGSTYLGLKGYLTTISSQEENDFIKQKLSADAWIGASDDYRYITTAGGSAIYGNQSLSEGKWYWVTGPEKGSQITTGNAPNGSSYPSAYGTAFNFWNLGEPNNYFDGSVYENVAEIYGSATNPGRWNDNRENQVKGYVVEYGGMTGDPLLFLSANRTVSILSILPLTGLEFHAARQGTEVGLRWSTRTETNTSHFLVEHSTDGARFNAIARMAAAGNSTDPRSYSAVHTTPAPGANYYRLRQVDVDGRSSFSSVILIEGPSIRASLQPNPASSGITIRYAYSGKPAVLTIYGVNGGRVIRTTIHSATTLLNVSSLPAGLYVAEIEEGLRMDRIPFTKQ